MSADEQPTAPDEEPRTAHYQRADASKFPTTPAGQDASVEGMAAAYEAGVGNSRRARRSRVKGDTPAIDKMRDEMFAVFEEYHRLRVAERALAGDPNPTDAEPLEYVYEIAEQYHRNRETHQHRAAFLDELAAELTLADVRALRLAGEAAVAATPRVVKDAAERCMKPPQIAAEIGLTERRVQQILREQRAQ